MYLDKLYLANFKNHEDLTFQFSSQVNCIVGENGSGKTNLLDAIYFIALTKSAFNNQDALSISHLADFLMLDGVFKDDKKRFNITCSVKRGAKKVVLYDKKPYERLSDHIGRFPLVLIAPDDTDLIREGSEERRRFFDSVLSQMDADYLSDYQQHNRLLEQRNALLKDFAERNYFDATLLELYTNPLLVLIEKLHQQRSTFMLIFTPMFIKHYANLSEDREKVAVIYESEVASDEFLLDFKRNQARDLAAQRTTMGVHRDDYIFEIDDYPVRKFGSQGQQKAFVMALRLAQFELLERDKNTKPILLLDDIFDKLDDRRIEKLIEMIDNQTIGQVFLTDARPERTQRILEKVNAEVKYFKINGKQKT
jgi:DNA replication and repair protein RecF